MKYSQIESELDAVNSLIARWQQTEAVPKIEQDIALNTLQKAYKMVMELPANAFVDSSSYSSDSQIVIELVPSFDHDTTEKPSSEEISTKIEEPPLAESDSTPANTDQDHQEPIPSQEAISSSEPTAQVELFGQKIPAELKERFVLELFWRDDHYFAMETAKLTQMTDLDEALIYIGEKYNWSAQSVTAEEFIALLATRLEQ